MSAEKLIKRTSLGEYNFGKKRRMKIKDVKGESIEKRCTKEGSQQKIEKLKKNTISKGECVLPCSLPSLSH